MASAIFNALDKLKANTKNKDYLMKKMIESKDGTIAAEGMIYAYERVTNEDELLKLIAPFKNDKRWNYWVTYNDQLYKVTLVAIKIRSNKELNSEEQAIADSWNDVLEKTYKLDYKNS